MKRADVLKIIYNAIHELNDEYSLDIKNDESTKIINEIDSIVLVNLIVKIESEINKSLAISITIADDRAFSRNNSPFKTVGILTNYILELINDYYNGHK